MKKEPYAGDRRKKIRELEMLLKQTEEHRKTFTEELKMLKAKTRKVQCNVLIDEALMREVKSEADRSGLTLVSCVEKGLELFLERQAKVTGGK